MTTRTLDDQADTEQVLQIWRDARWIDDSARQADGVRRFYAGGHSVVAPTIGQAESVGHWSPGSYRYVDVDLPVGAVTALLTSGVGRRRGLGAEVMTELLAQMSDDGRAVALLSAFEQGYYDRFGFASDNYQHRFTFDPSTLRVPHGGRAPVRIGPDDHSEFRELLGRRERRHGGLVLEPPELVEAEWMWIEHWWGLGLRADDGRLTAAMVGSLTETDGPLSIEWMAYESGAELVELLGALRALGDQILLVSMTEPPELRLQDVIATPNRQRLRFGMDGKHHQFATAYGAYQARIIDLSACIGAVSAPIAIDFDLRIDDPLANYGRRWSGVGGEYHVHLGDVSSIETGHRGGPLVHTDVGAFTQLWLGARSASTLSLLGSLSAPDGLISTLDTIFQHPPTHPGIPY